MPVTINGTTGISGVDGSASTPAVQGTDTNTGIFFPAADTIAFGEGGAEAMRIDSSGNLGIGTTSPGSKLNVDGTIQIGAVGSSADVGITKIATRNIRFDSAPSTGTGITVNVGTDSNQNSTFIVNGNVGIGTSSPAATQSGLDISSGGLSLVLGANNGSNARTNSTLKATRIGSYHYTNAQAPFALMVGVSDGTDNSIQIGGGTSSFNAATYIAFNTAANATTTTGTERARITSDGVFAVGKTSTDSNTVGASMRTDGYCTMTRSANKCLDVNRQTNDGTLVSFLQDNTEEGSISVSGTTVSYNGGHLSRWAQTQGPKDDTLVKGTVLSNLDEMNVYTDAEGNPVDNEQLNKVKVSDVEGDVNVAGVFVNWSYDEQHQVDEINMAMTGDMIIRIAQGVVVQKGDLLMSAGDGTAKPQGDDIVRSKTVAKVTSNHVTCTYEDGSYCVPCVLMAC